jgi:hypothetical protein
VIGRVKPPAYDAPILIRCIERRSPAPPAAPAYLCA